MAEYRDEHEGGGGFMMGLLTGTVLGAGLGMLLAPKSGSELRHQIGEQASSLGRRASEAAGQAADRAREAATRGAEEFRGHAGETGVTGSPRSGPAFGSGVGLGSTDTMSPGSGGTTGGGIAGGSTYPGGTGGVDRDRF